MTWVNTPGRSGKQQATVALLRSAFPKGAGVLEYPYGTSMHCKPGAQYGTPRCGNGLGPHPVVISCSPEVYPGSVGELSAGFWHTTPHADYGWGGHHRGDLR